MSERLQSLLIASQEGDAKAYHQFLDDAAILLRPFVRKRIFNESDAEDVLQDVLVGLHKARHSYIPGKSVLSWMYAIARYKMVDHIRKVSRTKDNEFTDDDILSTTWVEEIGAHIESDVADHLQDALNQLTETPKRIISMLKLEGYKIHEIASALNMKESAVKTAAHRGYKTMRGYLEKNYGY